MVSWLNKCCWEHRSQSTAAYKKSCWFSMLRFIWKLKYIKFGNLQACWNVYSDDESGRLEHFQSFIYNIYHNIIYNIYHILYIYYIWMFVFLTFFDPGITSRYAGLSQQWSLVIDIHFRWQFSHGLDSTNNPHRKKWTRNRQAMAPKPNWHPCDRWWEIRPGIRG